MIFYELLSVFNIELTFYLMTEWICVILRYFWLTISILLTTILKLTLWINNC